MDSPTSSPLNWPEEIIISSDEELELSMIQIEKQVWRCHPNLNKVKRFVTIMNGNFDIFSIAPIIQDVKQTIVFMRGHNLLLQDYFCCNNMCSKVMDISLKDREIFQCNNCHRRFSIRTGSFWFKSRLQLNILLALLFFFAEGLNISTCKKMLKSQVFM